MKKVKSVVMLIMMMLILFTVACPIYVQASDDFKPDDFDPSKHQIEQDDVSKIVDLANPIIGTIKVVGIIISVVMLGILGIKYMTGSVQEKAEYKKTMIPYLIGAILVVAITQLLGVIIEIVTNIK